MPEVAAEVRSETVQESMLEMHGRLFDVVCTSASCGHRELNFDSPICPALAGTENVFAHNELEPVIAVEDLPKCKKCGSLARPGVVWFGERPQFLDEIDELVSKADLCIVVGTSSTVRVLRRHLDKPEQNVRCFCLRSTRLQVTRRK